MVEWKKLSQNEILEKVSLALEKNTSFQKGTILGVPGTFLDERVFPKTDILKGNPFLTTLVANPNHIGFHTHGESESYFDGTHQLEKEAIKICAVDFMKAKEDEYDGYVASGGTEANIQATWMLRNYYRDELGFSPRSLCILGSQDTHYSIHKAGDLLGIRVETIAVDPLTRQMKPEMLRNQLEQLKLSGVKGLIFFINMATTMFGSVDSLADIKPILRASGLQFRIHIDGAFGGFIYPLTKPDQPLNFQDPSIFSITMDAHKMLQAPYGTGIFLCRKGLLKFTSTQKASYVQGHDSTLCGSRSGANAVAVWMILNSYGQKDARAFCLELIQRTQFFCHQLDILGLTYFNQEGINIITFEAKYLSPELIKKYSIVLDNKENPKWAKIVVMDHVKLHHLENLIADMT